MGFVIDLPDARHPAFILCYWSWGLAQRGSVCYVVGVFSSPCSQDLTAECAGSLLDTGSPPQSNTLTPVLQDLSGHVSFVVPRYTLAQGQWKAWWVQKEAMPVPATLQGCWLWALSSRAGNWTQDSHNLPSLLFPKLKSKVTLQMRGTGPAKNNEFTIPLRSLCCCVSDEQQYSSADWQ